MRTCNDTAERYSIKTLLEDIQFGYEQLPTWVQMALHQGSLVILPSSITVLTVNGWCIAKSTGAIAPDKDKYLTYFPKSE